MRIGLVLFSLVLVLSGATVAAETETEIDTDFMQTVEDTNKSLSNNIASHDANASRADASELQAMFAKVETFYAAKGDAADAVELSRKSRHLAEEVSKLVAAKNFDAASGTATDLARTCKACHNFYKKS